MSHTSSSSSNSLPDVFQVRMRPDPGQTVVSAEFSGQLPSSLPTDDEEESDEPAPAGP